MSTSTKVFLALLGVIVLASAATAQNWDAALSQKAVRLAFAAYCPPAAVSSWSCYWCKYSGTPKLAIVNTVIDTPTATMAYIGYDGSTIYVVFRGTTNIANVLVDVVFKKRVVWADQPNVQAHTGFVGAWKNLEANVLQSVRQARLKCSTCTRVVFTGHSLGAALATLASIDFARSNPGFSYQLLAIGSPRVGNAEFAAYAARMVPNGVRWTHANDPVVHLPMKIMGFQHRTREVWEAGSNSNYKMCSTTNGEDPTCANSIIQVDINILKQHSTYGGIFLGSGTCETFKREMMSQEEYLAIIHAANKDLQDVHTNELTGGG